MKGIKDSLINGLQKAIPTMPNWIWFSIGFVSGAVFLLVVSRIIYWLLMKPAQPSEPEDVINPEPWEVRKWMDELDD